MVPCRKCKRCLANRLTDLAGRAYAEALTSDSFVALTLTYNESNGARAQVLTYRDVQLFFKRLRKAGYKLRYYVAGEYGTKRGRAHWHCVLFWTGPAPKMPSPDTEKQMWSFWPHGFTYVQKPDYYGLLYVLKYAVKDDGTDRTTRRVMMSKKPPLGAAYWQRLAALRIDHGLPFAQEYTLPGARYKNGNAVRYWLSGASLQLAYDAHRAEWHKRGNKNEPPVKTEDYERVQKMIRENIDPNDGDNSLVLGFQRALPWLRHSKFDRALALTGQTTAYIVRLTDGHMFYCGLHKGRVRTWPLRDVAEAIATARGRRNRRPRPAGNLPPF